MTTFYDTEGADIPIPDDLAELPRWGVWRREIAHGREAKVPYCVRGHRASSTDASHWGELEAALTALRTEKYTGLAFAFFKQDGLVGIDLDDSLDGETPKPWASGIVEKFSDTYTEVSPSGNGLKIWARGSLPANLPGMKVVDGSIEMYDHGRYFAYTGRPFRGAPLQVEGHAEDILHLYGNLTAGRKAKGWPLQPLNGGRIPYGQQHATLCSIAGTLRARLVCDSAIDACLQEINRVQCERPGPPENISRIVRSSRKWGAA